MHAKMYNSLQTVNEGTVKFTVFKNINTYSMYVCMCIYMHYHLKTIYAMMWQFTEFSGSKSSRFISYLCFSYDLDCLRLTWDEVMKCSRHSGSMAIFFKSLLYNPSSRHILPYLREAVTSVPCDR